MDINYAIFNGENFARRFIEYLPPNYEDFFKNILPAEDVMGGISSKVYWSSDGTGVEKCLKCTTRNSFVRAVSDLEFYATGDFKQIIVPTEIYNFSNAVVFVQDRIYGKTLYATDNNELYEILRTNQKIHSQLILLLKSLIFHFDRKELFPDPVGYPTTNELTDSINLFLVESNGETLLKLCDVGRSPHEDTVKRLGESFYIEPRFLAYRKKMEDALSMLKGIN